YFVDYHPYSVPLQNVSVEVNIVDMIAETTVCQTYKNIVSNSIEAIYKFPLHEATAVCKFEAEIDGKRKIEGIVKEAKQAAKEYDEAIQQGQGAYLLEQHQPDVFQCSIGNITSGQTVVIKITYVTELKHDAETEKANYYLDIVVTCRMTSVIQSIESPSHHISTELNIDGNPNVSKITLAEQITYLEKDFILVVKSLGLDQPRAFVEYNPQTETNCIMLTLVPKFAINSIMTELIFVIDRSGSMQDGPMKKASEALQLLLRSLPEDCFFNVISFGSHFDSLFEKSQPYSENSFLKALKHAQEMTANYGGTEIYNPIKWAFDNSRNDMPTSVFLLTDGCVNNVDQIVELIKSCEEKKKDDVRFFSIGIGNSVSHNLVESVSRAGKGYAQFVTNNERMDKKILGMLKNAINPPIKDYNITWTNLTVEDVSPMETESVDVDKPTISLFSDNTTHPQVIQNFFTNIKIQQAPFLIPQIYSGVRFIVYCILEKGIEACKEIILSANSHDGPMKLLVPLDPVTLQGSKIHTLAARKLIQDLDDGTSFIHKHPRNNGKPIPVSLIYNKVVAETQSFPNQIIVPTRLDEPIFYGKRRSIKTSSSLNSYNLNESKIFDNNFSYNNSVVNEQSYSYNCLNDSQSHFADLVEQCSTDLEDITPDLSIASSYVLNFSSEEPDILATSVKMKPPKIETLYSFLNFQSFDGSFLPSDKFYSWFEECEMCYEKSKKSLKKEVDGDEQKINEILEKAKEWVDKWANE
ncbi:46267_t:CDS:10, partial [Gigaspora margarita]